ncbi:MAG: ribonuclease P protein component [Rhodothermaceae bacterium]|nr:MAG: ribonuclease P protein component [Rhodothermaceae bacterium]
MRLKRQRLIRPLFDRNRADVGSLAVGSVRLLYRVVDRREVGQPVPVQVGFSAGRGARPAVVRNRVKRILREVYRVHQAGLIDLFSRRDETLTLMVLYRGDPATARRRVPRDLPAALRKLVMRLEAGSPPA